MITSQFNFLLTVRLNCISHKTDDKQPSKLRYDAALASRSSARPVSSSEKRSTVIGVVKALVLLFHEKLQILKLNE